jgi:hypothetical protein
MWHKNKTYYRAHRSIRVLYGIMTMVPRTAILHSSPSIIETIARSNGTLGYAIDAVHVHGQPLTNSVPMNTGAITFKLVVDDDSDILLKLSVLYNWHLRDLNCNYLILEKEIRTSPQQACIQGPGYMSLNIFPSVKFSPSALTHWSVMFKT